MKKEELSVKNEDLLGTSITNGYVQTISIDPKLLARIERLEEMLEQVYYPMKTKEKK
jgi:hypothetical protein